jgi:signal-transduction protein with cAMP-binding, CBS, and nucleotidyltransferase domain
MSYKKFLQKLPVFSNVSKHALDKIQQSIVEKKFKDKEVIFEEGTEGEIVYIIYSGSVEIYKNYNKPNQKLLSVLLESDLFGETSLFSRVQRTATAVAKGETTVLEIQSKIFLDVFSSTADDGIKIVQWMLLNTMSRLERTSKELSTIYRISQIILESVIRQDEPQNFLVKISEEIKDVLPEFCSFGIYIYNNFNEEYQLVSFKGERPIWLKDIFEQNDEVVKTIFASEEAVIQDDKVYTYLLKEDNNDTWFIISIVKPQFFLTQQSKDLLLSISNLISVSIKSLKFLQEEKEKLKLQNVKSKYMF